MKKENILIINLCRESLHYYEFVKPIEDIVKKTGKNYFVKHYKKISKGDLKDAAKIIICGTSLKDNDFIKHSNHFSWLKVNNKPVLGICGGMHIIGTIFGGKLQKKTEIGFYSETFINSFLGIHGATEVYHLHNYYVDFTQLKDFDVFSKNNKIYQAVKHSERELYGVLFHPEVRNRELIDYFCRLHPKLN